MAFLDEPLAETHPRPAVLALEDGRIFNVRAAGACTRRGGEVVFNTSLTGYQEVFSDPSYSGQIVCLSFPHNAKAAKIFALPLPDGSGLIPDFARYVVE